MATSGEGILALIGGTRLRKKKRKGQGFPNFKSMTQVNISQGGEGFRKAVQVKWQLSFGALGSKVTSTWTY